MAEQDSTAEKTEEPTAKRLEKAREDGQVVRSQELSVAMMMIGVAGFMYIFGGALILQLSEVLPLGLFSIAEISSQITYCRPPLVPRRWRACW